VASVAVFGEGGRAGSTNKFMRAPVETFEGVLSLGEIYTGGQAFRHGKATNVAYLDLHVAPASVPHRGARANAAMLDLLGYPGNGFLSDDDTAYDPDPLF
jgi:prepilin-type processing-associated H-X9-DG protein